MEVSENGGTPKWLENEWKIMENPIEMDDLGVVPLQDTAKD